MIRPNTFLRFRSVRWFACFAAAPLLWACTAHRLEAPSGGPVTAVKRVLPSAPSRDLDILFVIDDSQSMENSQTKLAARLPDFMKVFQGLPGGLPNLHVAVVSSSLGAGIFSNVQGCFPGPPGSDDGKFQHKATCPLHPGATFISSIGGVNNFEGDIADAFSCIAALGDKGCGFEHQFASATLALQKASDPADPDNGNFLRPDAFLAVVMVTNEDDCSVPWNSTLIDPSQTSVTSALGGLQSYRCNEFGHLCDGQPPPHQVTGPTTLNNCVPAEGAGRLMPTSEFVDFLKGLKTDPQKLFVAALMGPTTPYVVAPGTIQTVNGNETQPVMQHSCMATTAGPDGKFDFADPGIRIKAWLDAFHEHAVSASVCENDFKMPLMKIADAVGKTLRGQCIDGQVTTRTDGSVNCQAGLRKKSATGATVETATPMCDATVTTVPCWRLVDDNDSCPNGRRIDVCWEAACNPLKAPSDSGELNITCAVVTGS
jgi:hypothetical protein